jgi:hypothetical protein
LLSFPLGTTASWVTYSLLSCTKELGIKSQEDKDGLNTLLFRKNFNDLIQIQIKTDPDPDTSTVVPYNEEVLIKFLNVNILRVQLLCFY